MKRLTAFLLILGLILLFCACGEGEIDTNNTTTKPDPLLNSHLENWITVAPEETRPIFDDLPTFPDEPDFSDIPEIIDNVVNILLVGQDAQPGEPPQRSDCMILVTFNKYTDEITLTSFLRDQCVNIPGYSETKLCHAYQYGGMSLLNQTIYENYGVEIQGNVAFNFSGFEEIINLLGGVEITLTQLEADALNAMSSKQWSLQEGSQTLTGSQALSYARLRHIDSDIQRSERQRKIVLSILNAYQTSSLTDVLAIIENANAYLTTNLSKSQITNYATTLFPMLSTSDICQHQIPAAGTYRSELIEIPEGYKAYCQCEIDFDANKEILTAITSNTP